MQEVNAVLFGLALLFSIPLVTGLVHKNGIFAVECGLADRLLVEFMFALFWSGFYYTM
jgi:hypothetical protein